jgi:alpha-L-fucosidase
MSNADDYIDALTVSYDADGCASGIPTYLADYAEEYARDPHEAAEAWFFATHIGLSVNLGLHSLLGKGEDALLHGELTHEQYALLTKKFVGTNFNAIDIVELAIAAGARYVVCPVTAGDGFSLYNSTCNDYNSVNSAANRDLFGELASTCEYHGLGLVAEFRFGRNLKRWPDGIPATPEGTAAYVDFMKEQLHEILTAYGPIAAVCFSGVAEAAALHPHIDFSDLYKMCGMLQPNTLVAFADAPAIADNDYYSVRTLDELNALPEGKPLEMLMTLTPSGRSFDGEQAGKHRKIDAIWEQLRACQEAHCNLLINTALMPDGSLDLEDINTLLDVGRRIEKDGLPD